MSLVAVIAAALETVRPAADAKQLRLDAELDPTADLMSGDRERIQQVIWNLLTNAIKFTAAGGRIMLETARFNDSVEITCRDTGIGIAPEFLPFVFDRFRQGESGTTRTQPGLGLGLAIVRHLVESHGGSVAAESGGRGAGAAVHVQLPIASQPRTAETKGPAVLGLAPASAEATSPVDTSLNLRVLVVEDDRDTRELMATALTLAGARVVLAASAREALSSLDAEPPDVIVSDIGMPDEDGSVLLRTLRAHPNGGIRDTPVVAVTAYARGTDRAAALDSGFHAHISKPVDLEMLLQVLKGLGPSRLPHRHNQL